MLIQSVDLAFTHSKPANCMTVDEFLMLSHPFKPIIFKFSCGVIVVLSIGFPSSPLSIRTSDQAMAGQALGNIQVS
jgi:hypothetical protein